MMTVLIIALSTLVAFVVGFMVGHTLKVYREDREKRRPEMQPNVSDADEVVPLAVGRRETRASGSGWHNRVDSAQFKVEPSATADAADELDIVRKRRRLRG
jgi:hypothetical protein